MISTKALNKFKNIYQKNFDEELSDEAVFGKAQYLLELYRVVYGDTSSERLSVNKKTNEEETNT